MASITKEFLAGIKKQDLYSREDANKLSELSKSRGFRNGKGYSPNHMRNFLLYQFSITDEVAVMIVDYYTAKKELKQKLEVDSKKLLEQTQEA